MKIPQHQARQVASLGRGDTGAYGAKAAVEIGTGRMQQGVANDLAKIAATFIQRKENAEYNDTNSQMSIEFSEWQEQFGARDFYKADELGNIPEDQVSRYRTDTNEDGEEVTAERNFIPAYEVYPLLLKQKLEGMIHQKAKQISNPDMRNQFISDSQVIAADRIASATMKAVDQQEKYIFNKGATLAMAQAAQGDMEGATYSIQNLETDDLVKAELMGKAELVAERKFLTDGIRSSDEETVLATRSVYEDPEYDGPLPEAERQAGIADLNNRLSQISLERDTEWKASHATTIDDYSVGIVDGQVTRAQLEQGYALWQADDKNPSGLSPPEHTALVKQLAASERASKTVADYAAIIADMRSGRTPGDLTNRDHVKAINWLVAQEGLTPENVDELSRIAINSNIMPQMLKTQINGFMMTDDPVQNAIGFQMYQNFVETDSMLSMQLGDKTNKIGRLASTFYDSGMNPVEAMKLANQWEKEVTPMSENFYRDTWNTLKKDDDLELTDSLEDIMDDDPTWDVGLYPGSDVPADPGMQMRFNTMTQHYFTLTKGDLARSKQMAYKAIRAEWGITRVGLSDVGQTSGERSTRYPPETMLQVSSESVQSGLDAYAKEYGIDPDRVILQSNYDTPKNMSWQVFVDDEETGEIVLHTIPFDGNKWVQRGLNRDYEKDQQDALQNRQDRETVDRERKAAGDEMFGEDIYK